MVDEDFTVRSLEWAERVFPARFKEVAKKKHGYKEGDSESKLVQRIHEHLGSSKPNISRWLSGKQFPRLSNILTIADAYDTSPDYLVGNDDTEEESFSIEALEARVPYDTVMKVLRIMSEIRRGVDDIPDDQFAEAGVKMLQMVERDPDMSEDAIIGAAYRLLRSPRLKS